MAELPEVVADPQLEAMEAFDEIGHPEGIIRGAAAVPAVMAEPSSRAGEPAAVHQLIDEEQERRTRQLA